MLNREEALIVKAAIARRGLYVYQVAAAIGINEQALSASLHGRRRLPPEKLEALLNYLDLTPETAGAGGHDAA